MSDTVEAKCGRAIGFLTVVDHPQFGLFGGYLLLNRNGRPLEFHCTAPIKPNRAQEILYGPTLASFLYGEQIGQTLVGKATVSPLVICTDREPAMAAREHVAPPLVLVLPGDDQAPPENADGGTADTGERLLRLDSPHAGPRLVSFQLGRNRVALPEGAEEDRRLVTERLAGLDSGFDLAEPFQRIRAAIEEAQQAVR